MGPQSARAGHPRHPNYFHVYPDRTMPDAFEQNLPEVFPEWAPAASAGRRPQRLGLDDLQHLAMGPQLVQPPSTAQLADVILYLANAGVEVLRLDALAFIWKRLGTNCQNQPEVHSITQVSVRALARIACPGVAFKAEAIVGPQELVQYLGQGRFYGKVSELAYHNSLMVHVWSMLADA